MTSDHVTETDEIAAELERAGLLTVTTREDGEVALLDAGLG